MEEALATLDRAVEECLAAPAWSLPNAALVDALNRVHAHVQRVAALELALIREVDGRGIALEQGAATTTAWLMGRYRVSRGTAAKQVRLAAALDSELAATAEALAAGEVNLDQVQVIAAAVRELPVEHRAAGEALLVEHAATLGPKELGNARKYLFEVVAPEEAAKREQAALERAEQRAFQGRDFRLSEVPGEDRVRISGSLDRESAAVVQAALDPFCAPRTALPAPGDGEGRDVRSPGQRRADALVEVCRLAMACGGLPDNGGDRPQVAVTVSLDTLREQVGAAMLDDGSLLSAEAARRLACDAAILPAVLGGASQVLDVARERRLFTGALRRALVLRDRGCAFPGCDRPPRWCDGHHIVHWADGGETNLANAVLLCGYHHRLVHHSEWEPRINPADGLPEFLPPAYIDPQQRPRRNRYHRRQ